MKEARILVCATALLLLSGCQLWIVPVAVEGLVTEGSRDISHKKEYWNGVERNGIYALRQQAKLASAGEHLPYDAYLSRGNDRIIAHLPKGTLVRAARVHYESNGFSWTRRDDIGVVESGPHKGLEFQLGTLLKGDPNGETRSVDPSKLRFVRSAEGGLR